MATIGNLVANLSLDSASFTKNMGKAERSLKSGTTRMNRALIAIDRRFRKVGMSVKRFAKSMVGFRGAAILAAGVAGLGLLIKKSLDTADSIAKTADAIGITTDALQEYRFAADLSGVSTDKLDKALKKATKSIGELRTRTSSELSTALKDFDSQLLSNIRSAGSVEQALDMVFRAMGRLEDQTQRVALATAVFGRSGIDLVNIVRDDEQALDRMRQQARDLGLVLEERLLRGAEKAKDQLSILAQVIGVNVTDAVLEAAPEIERLAKAFSDNVPGIIDWLKEFTVFIGLIDTAKVDRLREITEEINRINEAMNTPLLGGLIERFTTERIAKLKAAAAQIRAELVAANPITERFPRPSPPAIEAIADGLGPRRKDLGAAEDAALRFEAAREAAKASDVLQDKIAAETEAAQRNLDVIFATVETNAERYQAELDFLAQTKLELLETAQLTVANQVILERGAKAAKKRFEEANPILLERKMILGSVATATERLSELEKRLADAVDRGVISQTEANEVLRRTKARMGEVNQSARVLERGMDVLDSAIAGNMNTWQDWARVAVNEIQRVIAALAQGQQLSQSGGIFGAIGSLFKLFSTSGASAQVAGDLAGGVALATPFVHGGSIAAGQLALVGEHGKELFVPDTAGSIVPNSELGGGGIEGANVFIDASGADQAAIIRLFQGMKQLRTETPQIAIAAVVDARRRSPGLFR